MWDFNGFPIAGAAECLKTLKHLGKKLKFLSNNSTRNDEAYKIKFNSIGYNLLDGELTHPATQICNYMTNIKFDGLIYCIGSEPFKVKLREAGFKLDEAEDIFSNTCETLAKRVTVSQEKFSAALISIVLDSCAS